MGDHQAIVVGAGQAGVAASLALKDAGLRPLVIEEAEHVAPRWRERYDRLRLNTSRFTSHLPDRPFPKGTPMFPSRDDVIAHIERHSGEDGIELWLGTRVERIEPQNGGWAARTSSGEVRAPQVVLATGYEQTPVIPEWSGRAAFPGKLIHSSEYRNPEPYVGRRVLVVGPGCSGMEIAYDLAEGGAGKVWLAVRTPPNMLLRQLPGGIPGDVVAAVLLHGPTRFGDAFTRLGRRLDMGDLTRYGLPVPRDGVFTLFHRDGTVPAIVDKELVEAIKASRFEVVSALEDLDASGARLADGSRIKPDAVICATGYRRALAPLVGHLDVLDERELPRVQGEAAAAPGLRFIGYTSRPGALGYMGKQARRAAKAIASELR